MKRSFLQKAIPVAFLVLMVFTCVYVWQYPVFHGAEPVPSLAEWIPLDAEQALEMGVYSDDGRYLQYDGCTFVAAELEQAAELAARAASAEDGEWGRYRYAYLSSALVYSKAKSDVFGRVTLNPGQSATFSAVEDFTAQYVMAVRQSDGPKLGRAFDCRELYESDDFPVKNEQEVRRTAALSRVCLVHAYETFDRGLLRTGKEPCGRSFIWEPVGVFVYWEQA